MYSLNSLFPERVRTLLLYVYNFIRAMPLIYDYSFFSYTELILKDDLNYLLFRVYLRNIKHLLTCEVYEDFEVIFNI